MRRLGLGPTIMLLISMQCAQLTHAADKATLQRGAIFFKNYCAGCHSLRYMRPDSITGNHSLMAVSMPESDARQWFGRMPPDLSLTARMRGSAWLYAYLTRFYPDHHRPFGANNALIPNVAMPNVLYPLKKNSQLDRDLHDVISFLVYVAEPNQGVRYQIGFWVLLFLSILGVIIYQLKALYWRDIR